MMIVLKLLLFPWQRSSKIFASQSFFKFFETTHIVKVALVTKVILALNSSFEFCNNKTAKTIHFST